MLQSASLTRQQRNDARHVGFELNPGLFGVVLCKMFISHSVLEYLTVKHGTHAIILPRSTHVVYYQNSLYSITHLNKHMFV